MKEPLISALILAAGMSTRMGRPKQLLELDGSRLLEKVIRQVLAEDFSEIFAVIGHEAEQIQRCISIDDRRFRWVVNSDYRSGQSTSLKRGMEKIGNEYSAIMVFLGDTPFISEKTVQLIFQHGLHLLNELQEPFVVQPSFQGILGHPVFFGNVQMELFKELKGDQGAKLIMENFVHRKHIVLDDPGVLSDIDTPEDYEQARMQRNRDF